MASNTEKKTAKNASSSHPKYSEMVLNAIATLKERGGSSKLKILRFVVSQYKVEDELRANTHVKLALKGGVEKGLLLQVKGTGASGSFKLSDSGKKAHDKATNPTKSAAKTKTVTKKTTKKDTEAPMKTKAKSSTDVKKQGKSVTKKTDTKKTTKSKDTKSAPAKKTPAKVKKPKSAVSGKKTATKKPTVTKKKTTTKSKPSPKKSAADKK